MPATAACLQVPLGIHIDAASKSKVWSIQFVDLSILLSSQTSHSFRKPSNTEKNALLHKKMKKKNKINKKK